VAPAGTPKEITARLNSEIIKALGTSEVKERLDTLSLDPAGLGPEQFRAHMHSELRKWGKLVRDVGITAD